MYSSSSTSMTDWPVGVFSVTLKVAMHVTLDLLEVRPNAFETLALFIDTAFRLLTGAATATTAVAHTAMAILAD
ncbi:hypothetical protein Mapa_010451 [Marchantia paleacea]|nr:hypothetical protein Mapa_010451 [Marchantia paleacea]